MGKTFSLRVEKVVAGPIEEVFEAWLDARSLGRWMTPVAGGTADATTDPVVGGRFRIVMKSGQLEIPHEGVYLVILRPWKLVFTWNSPYASETRVTVELEQLSARSTRVVLVHELFPDTKVVESHRGGWDSILSALGRLTAGVEEGREDAG